MNYKNIITEFLNIFTWKEEIKHNFSLSDNNYDNKPNKENNKNKDKNKNTKTNINKNEIKSKKENIKEIKYEKGNDFNNKKENENTTIYSNISDNLNYIQTRFNSKINSDIIIREFKILVKDKEYKAFLLFIDGMVDSNLINDFILNPLMLRNSANTFINNNFNNNNNSNSNNFNNNNNSNNSRIISESKRNNVTIRKVKKIDIVEYISNSLLPQNSVEKQSNFDDIISGVNSGNCALFIDTVNFAFDIEVKGFKQRSIDAPNNEVIIKGPQEAFVENIRTNTSLLRRIVNSEKLVIENIEVGKITKTKCAVCYIEDITNDSLVSEVKYRLNNLEVDSLLSSGQLEQLIINDNKLGIPEILSTERPDKSAKHLLQGRVVILVNGSPYSLIMPATIVDFMASPEDTNLKPYFANFLRGIRFLSALITLLLPGIYVAVTSFHQEILPTELLYSILGSRENVPFPIIFEILIMEISFELIREAGLRVPSPIGSTIGIVGALVVGQAAVSANIVSPILIIIVALTGIASFAIPDFSFGFHLRFYRFVFILLGYIAGFLGLAMGLFVYVSIVCSINSFGVPFTVPFAPATEKNGNGYFIPPIWKQEYRATYLSPKKEKSQSKISKKWQF